jgi:pimeloyl-ACP methyl ester carboxylesterase
LSQGRNSKVLLAPQLAALAAAGFHAVAPDMRGYGQTDAPTEIEAYTLLHLVGDMVGLVSALGETSAVIAMTGVHRWPGTPHCCVPIASAP